MTIMPMEVSRFPNMDHTSSNAIKMSNMEKRFNIVKYDILVWESDESLIWDSDPAEASKFLDAVDEVRDIIEHLNKFQWTKADWQEIALLCRANDILQIAMARLAREFIQLLVQNCQNFEPSHLSFRLSEGDHVLEFSGSSSGEDSILGKSQSKSTFGEDSILGKSERKSSFGEDFILGNSQRRMSSREVFIGKSQRKSNDYRTREFMVSLIGSDALHDIKHIAEVMFASDHDKECCQAFISVRKDVLDEHLSNLQIEKLSIEEILQMDWVALSPKIRRWNWAMEVLIRLYLASEKNLCYKIFGELSESISENCFVQSSQGSLLQLLNFGVGISIGSPSPERVFCILDMLEQLTDLIPEIKELFPEESGSCILTECQQLLQRLIGYVRGALSELKNAIQHNPSTIPFAGGGVHHITRYVMNYLRLLADYRETLDSVLDDPDNARKKIPCNVSPIIWNVQLITSALVSHLDAKSMLYKDESLQHFFMMNNIHYMVNKVDGNLLDILGEDWLKKHTGKYHQHALYYERASWGPVLTFLKLEGICTPSSSSPHIKILKQRIKNFNLSFEDTYKTQTAWCIPNDELREDMRISISAKVLQAYRSFIGLFGSDLDYERHRDKYIKYVTDDLESYVLDLFEGRAKSLNSHRLH